MYKSIRQVSYACCVVSLDFGVQVNEYMKKREGRRKEGKGGREGWVLEQERRKKAEGKMTGRRDGVEKWERREVEEKEERRRVVGKAGCCNRRRGGGKLRGRWVEGKIA